MYDIYHKSKKDLYPQYRISILNLNKQNINFARLCKHTTNY